MKTCAVIIGAGVVGLAVAAEIVQRLKDVVVIEQHASFGQDTSSRSSEVIHAGIYYGKDSLRTKLCVEGKRMLYAFCAKHGVPHKRIGKIVVSTDESENEQLENLLSRGLDNGVEDLRLLSREEIDAHGPEIKAANALYSPSTGIVDSHALMKALEFRASEKGAILSYNTKVTAIEKRAGEYVVSVVDADGEAARLACETVVNCGGLYSDQIAEMIGIDIKEARYELYYSKGEFFRIGNQKSVPRDILVYPPPTPNRLGTHTIVDLQGHVKLGPKTYNAGKTVDYKIDDTHLRECYDDCRDFLPLLRRDDLYPDMSGLSPRLHGEGRDFVIEHEPARGLPGFVNLIGMDSPALTSSLAIAQYVGEMV